MGQITVVYYDDGKRREVNVAEGDFLETHDGHLLYVEKIMARSVRFFNGVKRQRLSHESVVSLIRRGKLRKGIGNGL